MSTTTTRLGLVKPDREDDYLVDSHYNPNLDILDAVTRYNQNETITGLWTFPNAGLKIKDVGGNYKVALQVNETLAADRTLQVVLNDANRSVDIQGNAVLDDWFDQAVKEASAVVHASLKLTDMNSAGVVKNDALGNLSGGNVLDMSDIDLAADVPLDLTAGVLSLLFNSAHFQINVDDEIELISPGGVEDHGLLTGLEDDDHTQYLLAAGSRGLSDNWDAGSYEIRAQTFQSDIATGTAPLIVASTTVVTNLNADLLDGHEWSEISLEKIEEGDSYVEVVDAETGYIVGVIDTAEIIRITPDGLGVLKTPAYPIDVDGIIKSTGYILLDGNEADGKFLRCYAGGVANWASLPGGGTPTYSIGTFTNGDATPDVSSNTSWKTATTGTTITNFDGGTAGKEFKLKFTNNTTIIENNANIILSGGTLGGNFNGDVNDTIEFLYDGSVWIEIGRSINS